MTPKKYGVLFSFFVALLLLSAPSFAQADNLPPLTGPETAKKFTQFRKQAGMDLLLPQVFQSHPGVTFMLSHAKDLDLTTKQINRLKVIRRKMIDRSLRQMERIENLRAKYLKLASQPMPPAKTLRNELHKIATLMAQTTSDHLDGHLKAARVLTKSQRTTLHSLK